jgi:hypothetical protein
MSDYLWDKTGEPEEDVQRLEELLGQLRFQPRTFEVPATLPTSARRAPRTLYNFSWSRLAVAASLLLTLLAGAWLISTKQRTSETTQQTAKTITTGVTETPKQTEKTTPQVAAGNTSTSDHKTTAPNGVVNHESHETATTSNVNRHLHREELSRVVKRLVVPPRQLNVRDGNAPHEEIADQFVTPQEREAMEKFMLAMKVTSEKLNYAERQVVDLNTKSPQK